MKKLLGLLAITPMAVTACGSADPVVEKEVIQNEVTYYAGEKILVVNNINLTGDEDYDGYDKLGHDIKSAWAENDEYGDAIKVELHGEIGGVEFNKDVDITTVHNDSDTASSFTTFKEVLTHYYKQTENMTTYANFAKHLKDATNAIVPVKHTEETFKGFTDTLVQGFELDFYAPGMKYKLNATIARDLSEIPALIHKTDDTLRDGWNYDGKGYYESTEVNPLDELLQLTPDQNKAIVDAFTSTDYIVKYWNTDNKVHAGDKPYMNLNLEIGYKTDLSTDVVGILLTLTN